MLFRSLVVVSETTAERETGAEGSEEIQKEVEGERKTEVGGKEHDERTRERDRDIERERK